MCLFLKFILPVTHIYIILPYYHVRKLHTFSTVSITCYLSPQLWCRCTPEAAQWVLPSRTLLQQTPWACVCASAQHHTYSHAQLSVGTTEFVHILHWRLEAWTTVHGIWWPLVNTVQVWWWSSDNSANLVAFGGQVRWSPDNISGYISVQCYQWRCVGLGGWDSDVTQNRQWWLVVEVAARCWPKWYLWYCAWFISKVPNAHPKWTWNS